MKKALIFGIKPTWDKSNLPSLLFARHLEQKGYEVTYIFDSMSFFHLYKWKNENKTFIKQFILSFTSHYMFHKIKCLTSFKLFPMFHKNTIYNFLRENLNFNYTSKALNNALQDKYDICWSSSYRQIDEFVKISSHTKIFSIEDNPYGFEVFEKSFLDIQFNKLKKDENIIFFSTSKVK